MAVVVIVVILNCPRVNATRPGWWLINIGSGDRLVSSSNKPLPKPMLTQIYVTIWIHWQTKTWTKWSPSYNPVGTRRNNNVFATSTRRRRRRVDVVKTLSLRHYCIMCPLGIGNFKCCFLYENHYILITILLKIFPKIPNNNSSGLCGSGNGLALYQGQVTTWINVYKEAWCRHRATVG